MAFSTFVFDTLDVSMRLGRYLLQELFGWRGRAGALVATARHSGDFRVYFLAFGEKGMWVKFWTLFGASNQLLAALSLLVITVWLREARQRIAFTLIPMLFVLTITCGRSRSSWSRTCAPRTASTRRSSTRWRPQH